MSSEDPRERNNLCGRELVPEGRFENLAEKYDPETWYEAEDGTHYCCREMWEDAKHGRCIWHADVEDKSPDNLATLLPDKPARLDRAILRDIKFTSAVDFSGFNLRDVDFSGADLNGVNFSDADLKNADLSDANLNNANLSNTNLENADLGETTLWWADILGANLLETNLSGANLFNTNLNGSYLWLTDFESAKLLWADLTGCKLRWVSFEEAMVTEETTFGSTSGYEVDADEAAMDESWLATRVSSRLRALGRPSTDSNKLEHAETQYRTIQRLRREHDLKQDPALEIQEKHARRKRALAEHRYWDWFKLAFYRWPMGYGEKPWHVVGTSVVVILSSTLGYFLAGPFARTPPPEGADVIGGALLSSLPVTLPPWLGELLASLYFSVVTFTTLGYGDLQPASGAAQAIATVESFLGALLMALLVFVLGRRATW